MDNQILTNAKKYYTSHYYYYTLSSRNKWWALMRSYQGHCKQLHWLIVHFRKHHSCRLHCIWMSTACTTRHSNLMKTASLRSEWHHSQITVLKLKVKPHFSSYFHRVNPTTDPTNKAMLHMMSTQQKVGQINPCKTLFISI